ncbi:MAG: hypothetical protein ACI31W_06420 [Lactococcus sp.]
MSFVVNKLLKLIIINVEIENHKYKFLIDTGSERSYIFVKKPFSHATKNYFKEPLKLNGIGGQSYILSYLKFENIEIEKKFFKHVVLLYKNSKNILFTLLNIQGIIGWDILRMNDFLLNFSESKLIFLDEKISAMYANKEGLSSLSLVKLPKYVCNNSTILFVDSGSNLSYTNYLPKNIKIYKKYSFSLGMNGKLFEKIYEIRRWTIPNLYSIFLCLDKVYYHSSNEKEHTIIIGTKAMSNKILIFINSCNKLCIESVE